MADPLADCAIGFASKLPGGSQKQTELLDISKTVCESAAQLVYATKDAGGNPKAVHHHPAVEEAAEDLVEALKDLTQQLEEAASDTGAVTALVNSINKARSAVRKLDIILKKELLSTFIKYLTTFLMFLFFSYLLFVLIFFKI